MKISTFAFAASVALAPVATLAGPCSDDIAALGKQLSQKPGMGAVTSGAVNGSGPGTVQHDAGASSDTKGTSSDARVGGTAGTKELNAASSNVATSDADVRQQQEGRPVAAAQGKKGGVETSPTGQSTADAGDEKVTRAKAAWQRAVDLNAQNDDSCHAAITQARTALGSS